jgi:predicted nucleotide-binding protein
VTVDLAHLIPQDGTPTTLADFCDACVSAPLSLGVEDIVVLRTMNAVATATTHVPFASALWIGDRLAPPPKQSRFFASGFYFSEQVGSTSDIANPAVLAGFLTAGLPHGVSINVLPLPSQLYLYRQHSHQLQYGNLPCWAGEIGRGFAGQTPPTPAREPVSNLDAEFVTSDPGDAAKLWLADPTLWSQANSSAAIRVVLRDPRAYFRQLKRVDSTLNVTVAANADGAYAVFSIATDPKGEQVRAHAEVVGGMAALPVGEHASRLDLTLTDRSGSNRYDRFVENQFGASWGGPLLEQSHRPQHAAGPDFGLGSLSAAVIDPAGLGARGHNGRVFVVHGHEHGVRDKVVSYLGALGLTPVVMQEEPNSGRTMIEKFEQLAVTGYAVVILTPDDVGAAKSAVNAAQEHGVAASDVLQQRARQNVILELGYFMGRIGRENVCALLVGDVEQPSDFKGIGYIGFDDADGWKLALRRELAAAGYGVAESE